MINQGLVVLSGIATFYVLADRFGVATFGIYASILAVVHIGASVAELGVNQLAVRDWSRTGDIRRPWGMSIGTHVVGGTALAGVLVVLQPYLAPSAGREVIALIAFSEIALTGTAVGAVILSEAIGRAELGTKIRVATSVLRLAALGGFAFFGTQTLREWALASTVSAAFAFAAGSVLLGRLFDGRPRPSLVPAADVGRGLGFGANRLLVSAQNDIDKVILAASGMDVAAGIYAAGYRIVTLSGLPLTGVVAGTLGRFFVAGEQSLAEAKELAGRVTRVALTLTAPVGVVLFLAAPLLETVMGEDFAASVTAVRFLAFLPCIKAMQVFPANALSGADLHGRRVALLVGSTLVNVVLNLILIPRYSWEGAVIATWISELLLAALLWLALLRASQQEASSSQHNSGQRA